MGDCRCCQVETQPASNKNAGAVSMTIEDAYEVIGFGNFQLPLLLLSGLGFFATTTELIMISLLRSHFQDEWPKMTDSKFSLVTSMTFVGELVGGLLWGFISDKVGRRVTFIGTSLMAAVFALLAAWSPCIYSLTSTRFFLGIAIGGSLSIDFVYFMEFVPINRRGFRTTFIILIGILAFFYVALLGQIFLPDWRRFVFACGSLYVLLFLGRCMWRYESPRLLLSKGKPQEAIKVLQKMASVNGKILPPIKCLSVNKPGFSTTSPDGFTTKTLTRLITVSLLFFGQTFGYYGLTIWFRSLATLRGIERLSPTLTFVAIGLAELPGLALTSYFIDRLGRKAVTFGNFCGSAISAALLLTVQTRSSFMLVSSLCYFFIVGSWASLYVSTPELFPTSIRTRAFAIAGGVGKLAGILSPMVFGRLLDSGADSTVLVMIISGSFAISALLAAGLSIETSNKSLN